MTGFYYQENVNSTHQVYTCYKNFHLVSGDLVHNCSDTNTWVGENPYCEVDYNMDKYRLSAIIAVVITVCCVCLLVPDFLFYYYKKRQFKNRTAIIQDIKKEMAPFGRTQTHYVRSEMLETIRDRKSYFQKDYEEDFLGTSPMGHYDRGSLSDIRIHTPRTRTSPHPSQSRRKPATFLTLMTQAFRQNRPPDN